MKLLILVKNNEIIEVGEDEEDEQIKQNDNINESIVYKIKSDSSDNQASLMEINSKMYEKINKKMTGKKRNKK